VSTATAAVGQAAGEIRRISSILDDFMVFARPQPLQLERADVRGLVARAIERSGPRARSAGATVALEPGVETLAEVDASRVVTAVSQLIANAVDAAAIADDHVVRIRVESEGNSVVIVVEDRGAGVPPGESQIFEPFFTTKKGGTGLGLSIVQRVASEHGGSIEYERRDGATVFRLELPIVAGIAN
jgi:signal transduction histidine kinase